MKLARVVVRFPVGEREGLDRLRTRYFEESGRGLSRASIVRVLVHRALDGIEDRSAADVLGALDRSLVPRSVAVRCGLPKAPPPEGQGQES